MEKRGAGDEDRVERRGCWPALHEFYRSGIDTSLIDENLKLSVPERFEKFASFMRLVEAAHSSRTAPIRKS